MFTSPKIAKCPAQCHFVSALLRRHLSDSVSSSMAKLRLLRKGQCCYCPLHSAIWNINDWHFLKSCEFVVSDEIIYTKGFRTFVKYYSNGYKQYKSCCL